jgi:hypothetical protein
MVSDFICATVPIFLIWNLSRSVVEKTLISILMATCLLATGCGVAKLYYMITFDFTSKDGFYLMISEFFWCRMEESIIIIAACAPLLKCPIERGMRRLGLPTFQIPARELNVVSSVAHDSEKDADSWQGRRGTESTQSDLENGVVARTRSGQT